MIKAVDVRQVGSKSELLDMLGSRQILLGTEIDAPREFYCVELGWGSNLRRVGILSAGVGIKPGWVTRNDKLYIGFNSRVAILGSDDGSFELIAEIELLTLFWEFLEVPSTDDILVLAETAVVALTSSGNQLWRIDTDLITNSEIMGTILHLEFCDDPAISVDLMSGAAS